MHRRKQTEQKMMSERQVLLGFLPYFSGDSYLFSYLAYKYFLAVNYGFER